MNNASINNLFCLLGDYFFAKLWNNSKFSSGQIGKKALQTKQAKDEVIVMNEFKVNNKDENELKHRSIELVLLSLLLTANTFRKLEIVAKFHFLTLYFAMS